MTDIFRDLLTREVRVPVVVTDVVTFEGGEQDGKRAVVLDNGWVLRARRGRTRGPHRVRLAGTTEDRRQARARSPGDRLHARSDHGAKLTPAGSAALDAPSSSVDVVADGTPAEPLDAIAAALGRPPDDPFARLIEWLRDLQAETQSISHREQALEGEVASLQEKQAAADQSVADLTERVAALEATVAQLEADIASLIPGPAAGVVITIQDDQGESVNGVISVDAAGKTATLSFVDDHNNPTPDPPVSADGGAVTFAVACSDPAVATLAASPSTALTFDITPLAPGGAVESTPGSGQWTADGSVTLNVSATDDQGQPAVFADGQPITGSTAFGVFPGAAAALAITVD